MSKYLLVNYLLDADEMHTWTHLACYLRELYLPLQMEPYLLAALRHLPRAASQAAGT